MKIPQKGLKRDDIMKILRSYKSNDMDWRSGKVFGYVYEASDDLRDVIHEAYTMYLTENALDPLTYPSLLRLENEVVAMAADLLRGGADAVGNFTSGGTESIMMAVLSARNRAREL
ncbi:MAG: pyridoxal-dependent decarboxylase, partial [bacterium]